MIEFSQQFIRSSALNNVPKRKLQEILNDIQSSSDDLQTKNLKSTAYNRYAEANIPIEYWFLKIEKGFSGKKELLDLYNGYVKDLKKSYSDGRCILFASTHGTGKTLTSSCILKKACQKNYNCLYTTLSDIVAVLTQSSYDEKFIARRELMLCDFLVVDEMDPRFFNGSEQSIDLFARSLENIFRTRKQNKLPTLFCTNSPNILEAFNGPLKQSLTSIFNGVENFTFIAPDFRKQSGNNVNQST